MIFQLAPVDTSNYMIAGYAISFIVMGAYIISLIVRGRNLQKDLIALEELEK